MSRYDVYKEPTVASPKRVEKTWGHELWIHNSIEYCGKLLVFEMVGSSFSMHYHMDKNESWYVQQGSFWFEWIDTTTGTLHRTSLAVGECVDIHRGLPHKLTAKQSQSIIFEVSEHHNDFDSYRIYRDSPQDLL